MRLTVLHVTAPARFGGLERVVEALAGGHRRAGHAVHVAVILDGSERDHLLAQALRQAGVAVELLALPTRAYLRERAAIAALCRRLRPAVVHTHGYRPDVVDGAVPPRFGIPVVTTVHGFTGGDWRNRFYEWLQVRAYRRFDGVVAVSRPIVERLTRAGVAQERILLLPNAWNGGRAPPPLSRAAARAVLGLDAAGARIGWAGRLSAEKGPDVMVSALARLDDPTVRLSMLGDGPKAAALRGGGAAAAGVAERVTWHGVVPAAGRLLRAFDVFVLSSRTEGTPMVLFEAMAAGVPVVTTAVGGVPDVVSDTEALLVPPNDPAALAAAISAVLGDPAGARRRAEAARRRLEEKFRLGPWLERYESLYRTLAAGGRAGARA